MMYEQELASLKAQGKQLFGNEIAWVEMHSCVAWDKVNNQNPQNASPSEINEPYEPSPRMDSYEQPLCLGSTFLDDMIELPKSQPKITYKEDLECKMVMVKIPKCMAWLYDEPIGDLDMMEDKVDNPSPQRIPMEVEPLDHMKLEDLGLNTSTRDLFLSSRGFPSVDESKPQLLPKFSPLDVNLGDKRGTDPPINQYSPGSFRMKVISDEKKLGITNLFDFPADDPVLDLEDDPVLDIEEDPGEEEDMEVEEDIPLVTAPHAGSPPISPPPLYESSSDFDFAAHGHELRCLRQDTDALQGNVRTLVRGMKTHKTEIITAHNGVDRIRKRMDAFDVDIAFLEQATARVEDDVLALQARAETIEARQLQAEQDMTFWEF
ncbi:hypothetical protein Tco_0516380 [Tanacetum coccineum]